MDLAALQSSTKILAEANIPELPDHYCGMVRDNTGLADGRRVIIACR